MLLNAPITQRYWGHNLQRRLVTARPIRPPLRSTSDLASTVVRPQGDPPLTAEGEGNSAKVPSPTLVKQDDAGEALQSQPDEVSEEERLRRQRISTANTGKVPWNKGRKHSPETIAKIKERTALAMLRPEVAKKVQAQHEKLRAEAPKHDEATKARIRQTLLETHRRKAAAKPPKPPKPPPAPKPPKPPKPPPAPKPPPKSRVGQTRLPEHRAAIAEAVRLKWQDPEYRERALEGMRQRAQEKAAAEGRVLGPPRRRSSRSSSSSSSSRTRSGGESASQRSGGTRRPAMSAQAREALFETQDEADEAEEAAVAKREQLQRLRQLQLLVDQLFESQRIVASTERAMAQLQDKRDALINDPHKLDEANSVLDRAQVMLSRARERMVALRQQIPPDVYYDTSGRVRMRKPGEGSGSSGPDGARVTVIDLTPSDPRHPSTSSGSSPLPSPSSSASASSSASRSSSQNSSSAALNGSELLSAQSAGHSGGTTQPIGAQATANGTASAQTASGSGHSGHDHNSEDGSSSSNGYSHGDDDFSPDLAAATAAVNGSPYAGPRPPSAAPYVNGYHPVSSFHAGSVVVGRGGDMGAPDAIKQALFGTRWSGPAAVSSTDSGSGGGNGGTSANGIHGHASAHVETSSSGSGGPLRGQFAGESGDSVITSSCNDSMPTSSTAPSGSSSSGKVTSGAAALVAPSHSSAEPESHTSSAPSSASLTAPVAPVASPTAPPTAATAVADASVSGQASGLAPGSSALSSSSPVKRIVKSAAARPPTTTAPASSSAVAKPVAVPRLSGLSGSSKLVPSPSTAATAPPTVAAAPAAQSAATKPSAAKAKAAASPLDEQLQQAKEMLRRKRDAKAMKQVDG